MSYVYFREDIRAEQGSKAIGKHLGNVKKARLDQGLKNRENVFSTFSDLFHHIFGFSTPVGKEGSVAGLATTLGERGSNNPHNCAKFFNFQKFSVKFPEGFGHVRIRETRNNFEL